MNYTVYTYPEGNIALVTEDLSVAVNLAYDIEGYIIDEHGNEIEF